MLRSIILTCLLVHHSLHKLSDSCSIKLWCRQIGIYTTVIVYETTLGMMRSEQENCIRDSTVLRPLELPELLLEMKQVWNIEVINVLRLN